MALRESVGAEALYLVKAAFGKIPRITPLHHTFDHLFKKPMDGPRIAKRRHGSSKLICLLRRELRRHDGDLHRLLLKQRHAHRPAKHLLQLVGRSVNTLVDGSSRFLSLPTTQIRMHHIALDRPRTHDRHLNHQVIEFSGRSRGSMFICARDSTWNTPMESPRHSIS